MKWFLLALIALLFWSGSDFFSKVGSKPDDKLSHWKMVMAVGFVMGLHAAYEVIFAGVPISLDIIIAYLPASFLYILSMAIGYIGLRYIELSVSSPICNSSGAMSALMCFFILHERMEPIQTVAVVVICFGVLLLGIVSYTEDDEKRALRQAKSEVKYTKSLIAVLIPVIYCLIDAAGTFADSILLKTLNEESANVAYEFTFLAMGIVSAIYVLMIKREPLTRERDLPKLIGGICETIGQFAYVFALAAYAIGAAPVISAYCVASVVWSRIFLKEKLSWKHYLAIAITVVGIVLLGIYEGISGEA